VDERCGFNYRKQKNVTPEIAPKVAGTGDIWLWVAIDADTQLAPRVMLGSRNAGDAYDFVADLASRMKNRVQLTSDGHRPYLRGPRSGFWC
jgi:transposase-like protein